MRLHFALIPTSRMRDYENENSEFLVNTFLIIIVEAALGEKPVFRESRPLIDTRVILCGKETTF